MASKQALMDQGDYEIDKKYVEIEVLRDQNMKILNELEKFKMDLA
jgi:hypothetical protein